MGERVIVVTVDLDSARGPENDKQLFTLIVTNDGSGTPAVGNYNVYLGRRGVETPLDIIRKPLRQGRVLGHRRKSTHAGTLIRRALESVNL